MKLHSLQILIWNDQRDEGLAWQQAINSEGYPNVSLTTTTEKAEFLDLVRTKRPDAIILDIYEKSSNGITDKGFSFLKELRKYNRLVAVLCVSRALEQFIGDHSWSDFEELGVCGFWSADTMKAVGGPIELAIETSVQKWHLVMPHFALCLEAFNSLEGVSRQTRFVSRLKRLLNTLPQSATLASWHSYFTREVGAAFGELGLFKLEKSLSKVALIFEKCDQFYMAQGGSREHLTHNILVCLLGISIICNSSGFSRAARNQILPFSNEEDWIEFALVGWIAGSVCHDVGYLLEKGSIVGDALTESLKDLGGSVDARGLWPKVAMHHSEIGVSLWRSQFTPSPGSKIEEYLLDTICSVVGDHDYKHNLKEHRTVAAENWAGGLAVLCDELQDWGRERPEALGVTPAGRPWRSVVVERVTSPNTAGAARQELELDLLYTDHDKNLRSIEGQVGEGVVRSRFIDILRALPNAIPNALMDFDVRLHAKFAHRPEAGVDESMLQIKKRHSV